MRQAAHSRHPIGVDEDVGALRRAVAGVAAGQRGVRPGTAELAATELGTNLVRHAEPGGYVLYRRAGDGIELLSVDHGPGMNPADVPPPTLSTPGDLPPILTSGLAAGLAGIQRIATDFDCYSTSRGTVILARLGATPSVTAGRWRWAAVNVPLGGAGESGDALAVTADRRLVALVVDGLGHGLRAAAAADAAIEAFERRPITELGDFVERAHESMRATRGGVLGVCVIDPRRDELSYVGVGNITAQVVRGQESHHLISRAGTLGTDLAAPRPYPQHRRWEPGATLMLATDGIRAGWDLTAYHGLLGHDPSVIAATLHRDHQRDSDDSTLLVIRDATHPVT